MSKPSKQYHKTELLRDPDYREKLTPEEKAKFNRLMFEIYCGGHNKPDSEFRQNIDLDAIEEGALDSYFRPITRSSYIDQEQNARKRDLFNKWEREEAPSDEEHFIPKETQSKITQLPPLKQLAVDIIHYKYDLQGAKRCKQEAKDLYEEQVKRGFYLQSDLDKWLGWCEDAVRKITSSKKTWNKVRQ